MQEKEKSKKVEKKEILEKKRVFPANFIKT